MFLIIITNYNYIFLHENIFKTTVVQYRQINAGHACAALSLVAVVSSKIPRKTTSPLSVDYGDIAPCVDLSILHNYVLGIKVSQRS